MDITSTVESSKEDENATSQSDNSVLNRRLKPSLNPAGFEIVLIFTFYSILRKQRYKFKFKSIYNIFIILLLYYFIPYFLTCLYITYKKYKNTMKLVPKRYIPSFLTSKDRQIVKKELVKSRKLYRKGIYYTRKNVNSFPSKKSSHIIRAEKIYALSTIEKKGQGAYFSSGSRPNQSAHSWGRARLASAITGGKSAAVDFSILDAGCNHATSKAYKMARRAVEKYGYGKRHTPRVKL